MKLILILFLFVSIQSIGQNYLELRQEYKNYCEEELIDTITQHGYVTFKIGDNLTLIPKDTVWEKAYCPEYYEQSNGIYLMNSSIIVDTIQNFYSEYPHFFREHYSEPKNKEFQIEITRDKYCNVKRRYQSSADFWYWVEENYLK